MSGIDVKTQSTHSLHDDALAAMSDLRRVLGDLIAHLPGTIRRPMDLQRVLGVDYRVCWQILNIARSDAPLTVSHHVPTAASMKRLLAAAAERGVQPEKILAVEEAVAAFHAVVSTYASDRAGFDVMLASIAGGDAAEVLTIQHRRNAYRSVSPLWGVQMDVALHQMIVRLSADGRGTNECYVNVKNGLRLLRSNVRPLVQGHREPPALSNVPLTVPLDASAAGKYGAPVLPEFCSQPMPRFQTTHTPDGWDLTTVDPDQMGRRGAVSLAFSGLTSGVPFTIDTDGRPMIHTGMLVLTPVELAVLELFVHRESFPGAMPQLRVFAYTPGGYALPEMIRYAQNFELHEKVGSAGPASKVASVPELMRYTDMVPHVFDRLGWDAGEFDVFRARVEYPLLHTMSQLWFPHEPR